VRVREERVEAATREVFAGRVVIFCTTRSMMLRCQAGEWLYPAGDSFFITAFQCSSAPPGTWSAPLRFPGESFESPRSDEPPLPCRFFSSVAVPDACEGGIGSC